MSSFIRTSEDFTLPTCLQGGAVYAVDGKITVLGGITSFADNVAVRFNKKNFVVCGTPAYREPEDDTYKQ